MDKTSKTDIKIIYTKAYIGRLIIVAEYKGERTLVYRSSGFSGTGNGGEIIPFNFLNTRNTLRGPIVGYLWKEYFCENRWREHRKYFTGQTKRFLDDIGNLVRTIAVDRSDFKLIDEGGKVWLNHVERINKELRELLDGKIVDYSNIEKEYKGN